MIIETVNKSERDKLRLNLEKHTSSLINRGVSFVVQAFSEHVGTVTILVTGKKGVVQKVLIVVYNESTLSWEAFSEGVIMKLDSLSEISTVAKSTINKLAVLVQKI